MNALLYIHVYIKYLFITTHEIYVSVHVLFFTEKCVKYFFSVL